MEERRAAITACYRQADSAQSFVNALEAAGYILARGDSRAFVVVDLAGDVHTLARQIKGARTSDVKAKLEGVNSALLPSAQGAKIQMAQRTEARQDAASAKRRAEATEAAEKLKAVQRKRRAALGLLWQKMKIRQMHESKVLLAHIKAEEVCAASGCTGSALPATSKDRRPGQLPGPTARQLPDLSTTIWVDPASTGEPRHRGALNFPG